MKRIISITAAIILLLNTLAGLNLNVFANENRKVTGVQMTFADLVENRDGYFSWDYDENDVEHEYFRYNVRPCCPGNTLTFIYSDGTSEHYSCVTDEEGYGDTGYWFRDDNGNWLSYDIERKISVTDDQSSGNPWGSGEHTVTVRYGDEYYDDYIIESYAAVKIVENPIASVDFDYNYNLTEGVDGDVCHDEDDNLYFSYDTSPFKTGNVITFNYRDGRKEVYTCEYDDNEDSYYAYSYVFINDEGEVLVTSDNDEELYCEEQYNNKFSYGENYVNIRVNLLGYRGILTVPVTVVPNPVGSIAFTPCEPIVYKEYFGGRFSRDYDNNEYYYYNDFETLEEYVYKSGSKLTLNYTDSTSKEFTYNEETQKFAAADGEELTQYIYCYADQDKNHWVKGENNSFTVRCFARETAVPVEITDNGLERIEYHQAGEREMIVSNGQAFKNETWDNLKEDTVELFFDDGTSMLFKFDEGDSRSEFVCGRESIEPSRILNDDGDFSSVQPGETYSFKYSYLGVPVTGATCTVKAPDVSNVEFIVNDNKIYKNRRKKYKYPTIEHKTGNILRVTFTGGNVKEYVCSKDGKFTAEDGSRINEKAFSYGTTQEGTWDTGIHQMYVSYYGITAYYDVEIREKEDTNHGEIRLDTYIGVDFDETDISHSYTFTPSKSGEYEFWCWCDYSACPVIGTLYLDGEKLIEGNGEYGDFNFTYYCEKGKTYLFVLKTSYNSECEYTIRVKEPPHVHSYTEIVTAPTCTKGGYTTYTCECGDSYIGNETKATGHTVIIVDAAVSPTFKKAGKTEGSHCAICGAVLTKQTAIPKLKAAKLKSLTGGKSSFTAKWNKVKGVDGYQLQYSLSKKFKSKKTVTVKSAKSIKKTVKKLKAKKTYYVRIRAYKTVSGKKLYSKWSKAEKAATK